MQTNSQLNPDLLFTLLNQETTMTLKNPTPELAPMLKQLRLSGILDSLDTRNQQAIKDKMAYTDFLSLLISDEVATPSVRIDVTQL